MGLLEKVRPATDQEIHIDWELTPEDSFGTFESWGGRERVRSHRERFYYFYIDGWQEPPRLLFVERGIKYLRVLARIEAPLEMLERCIATQGKGPQHKDYAIDAQLRQWLIANVIDTADDSKIRVLPEPEATGRITGPPAGIGLPGREEPLPEIRRRQVRHEPMVLNETELPGIIEAANFFDSRYNPAGEFANYLVDNGDGLTVTDLVTGVMWQRGGCDITAIRQMHVHIQELNRQGFAGYSDWRLPTLEEALALLEPVRNARGLHLHPCFAAAQPFIFLADERRPGGYWFIDFKQATVFWASGTIPGGFGRVCRTAVKSEQ
jgi:hypothetical protein